MTWLTALLIVWAAAILGLLVGALMCAAGRGNAGIETDAHTSADATAGATDTALVKPEASACDDAIVQPRLPRCPRCGGEPAYAYNDRVRIECVDCGYATSWHPRWMDSARRLEREWCSMANNYAEQNPAKQD